MQWSELYREELEPSKNQLDMFVGSPLWDELTQYLQQTYKVEPKLFYSHCSMDKDFWKGWNVKYKKSGKSLCTLYPKQGYFVAIVPVGTKEAVEVDLLILLCDKYTQDLYSKTKSGVNGKSLALDVTSKNILCDVKELVALRVGSRKSIKGTSDQVDPK